MSYWELAKLVLNFLPTIIRIINEIRKMINDAKEEDKSTIKSQLNTAMTRTKQSKELRHLANVQSRIKRMV